MNTLNVNILKQPKLHNSFEIYSFEDHIFEIIEECSLEQLNERETFLEKILRWFIRMGKYVVLPISRWWRWYKK